MAADRFVEMESHRNFSKARQKEFFRRILNVLSPDNHDLLSLEDIRRLVKPKTQSYQGMKVIPLEKIVGSEGRYQDFDKSFLPKREYLKSRWTRVDQAHQKDIILPPITLYEIGGLYFVRDGNHRVSVARTQGVQAIDAEVISLSSELRFDPKASKADLIKQIVQYEKEQFEYQTNFSKILPHVDLQFTATGRFSELLTHIHDHKYFINLSCDHEISLDDAIRSWYEKVYKPIVSSVLREKIHYRFAGRTADDLYMWIVKHWHFLKERFGDQLSVDEAAKHYGSTFGVGWWEQLKRNVKGFFRRWFG